MTDQVRSIGFTDPAIWASIFSFGSGHWSILPALRRKDTAVILALGHLGIHDGIYYSLAAPSLNRIGPSMNSMGER